MPVVGVITGLSTAWLLIGAGAALLPVLAHLLARLGGPVVVFPAARFIQQAVAAQAKRSRVRDAVLLALRILAVVLLALAFDRPSWVGAAVSARATGGEWVIVLDASASMTRADGGRTLFDLAREQAVDFVRGLDPAADRAGVVICGASATPLLPRLTRNFPALLEGLGAGRATLESCQPGAALALAASLPGAVEDRDPPGPRRVVVFTDGQRSNWSGVRSPAGVEVMVRVVGEGTARENLSVTEVTLSPARPAAGRPVTLTATVGNWTGTTRPIPLSLTAGAIERAATIEAPAWGTASASFEITLEQPGFVPVRAAVVDSPFTVDDAAWAAAEVRPAWRLGLVSGARDGDAGSASHYLAAALSAGEAGYDVVRLTPAGLSMERLGGLDALVMCEAGAPDDHTLRAVGEFMSAGGCVVWVADSGEAARSIMRLGELGGHALPARLGGEMTTLAPDQARRPSAGPAFSEALRGMEGPIGEALLRTTFAVVAEAEVPASARVMLGWANAEDGRGALGVWGAFGGGRLLLVLADLAPGSTELVKSPVFPVLAHELARFALPTSAMIRPGHPGGSAVARVSGEREPEQPVRDRSGTAVNVQQLGLPGASMGEWLLTRAGVEEPGLMEFTSASGGVLALAAVNLDPAESDPRAFAAPELAEALAREDGQARAAGAGELARTTPRELWPALFTGLLAVMGVEALISMGLRVGARARRVSA